MNEAKLFDEEGFLKDAGLWTEKLSKSIAEKEFDIILTDLHLKIIRFVREYYMKWETLPMLKTIRDEFDLKVIQIDEMFKRGDSTSRGVICKLGGLPKMLCIASGC